jgi:putative ABC transport system permease protein
VLPMDHPLVDSALVPEFKGIADADKVSNWHAPFPIDLKRVRQKDEDYWEKYRATPKAVVSLETGRKLWGNRFGNATSLVWRARDATTVRSEMLRRFDAVKAGLEFRAIKEMGLRAASGSTDFGQLFVGFSLFLLVAAAMLIQVLFRLGVEERAREFGLLAAVGFRPHAIRRLMMLEGGIVALVGAALGTAGSILYGRLLVYGLNTWWAGSIGTSFLRFAASWESIAVGFVTGWFVAMLAIWFAARSLSRMSARALLAGRIGADRVSRGRRRLAIGIGVLCAVAATALAAFAAPTQSAETQAATFFSAGALLLVAALAFFRAWLGGDPAARPERLSLVRLGTTATKRQPGRSLMVAGLMASATFLIVAVGANRQVASARYGKDSGTGGFALLAEASVPIYRDIARMEFGDPARKAVIAQATIYPLRVRSGEDASCLNLYRATRPRIVGVGGDFVRRGGFHFSAVRGEVANGESPWRLLEMPLPDGAIPAIGDYTTVFWLLHLHLGGEIEIDGARLRIVGLLDKSIFQSELLISEANFKRAFPDQGGWRMFAVDAPPQRAEAVSAALEAELGDYGFDAVGAGERLSELMRVENTYLSTFLSLGGLGLLLGTFGLALALLRNLMERRAEFALLRAVGYRFSDQLRIVIAENGLLLVVGMGAGALCALVGMVPVFLHRSALVPWGSLALVLAGVFFFGICAAAVSAWLALRGPIVPVLKEEH